MKKLAFPLAAALALALPMAAIAHVELKEAHQDDHAVCASGETLVLHFVHNQYSGNPAGATLDVTYANGVQTTISGIVETKHNQGTVHWWVDVPGNTLITAVSNLGHEGNLVLSDWDCEGEKKPKK